MKLINGSMELSHIEAEDLCKHIGERIKIHGSVYKIRTMSGFSFVILRTKRNLVQCIYSKEFSKFDISHLKEESCILVTADIIKEERSKSGFDLRMISITILSEPMQASPIVINHKQVDTSLENLLNYRPITLRNERERAIFKLQEGICHAFISSL